MTAPEADAASLRQAFARAAETFPASVAEFLLRSRAGAHEADKLTRWFKTLYDAITNHTAGLELLGELAQAKEKAA